MKAFICTNYGSPDVLELREVPKPIPKDDEILIKVRATTVSSGDWRVRSLELPRGFGLLGRLALGVRRPRQPILGTELAGDVEAVGKDVRNFEPGDAVFAFSGAKMGCHAEYTVVRQGSPIAKKPASLTYDEAATLSFGNMTALDFFRRGKLSAGEDVLVNGASGAVGVAAVQLAKHLGAHVTAVCSRRNHELVRSLGADELIDHTTQDFAENGKSYDVIVDTAGTAPYVRSKRSLKAGGRLLLVLSGLPEIVSIPWVRLSTGVEVVAGPASERAEDLQVIAKLAESGELKPVVDRRYAFAQMADAHRYVDAGHKRGSVVVTLP
jgi:NADPH:quinone reductase-like Zn-dependent oxidoreductase